MNLTPHILQVGGHALNNTNYNAIPMSKKNIKIPVSSFTWKIIAARYGHPVQASAGSHRELIGFLQVDSDQKPEKLIQEGLTEKLTVCLQSKVANMILKRDLEALGAALHNLYLQKMYEFVYAQTSSKLSEETAAGAIRNFFQEHNLDDDDYNPQTAYRQWQRWKKDFEEKKRVFQKNGLLKRVNFVLLKIDRVKERLEGQKMRAAFPASALKRVIVQHPKLFRNKLTASIIAIYLYREYCQMAFSHIAKKTGRSKTTVQFHYNRFERRIKTDEKFRRAVEMTLTYIENCKTSVLLPRPSRP